MCVDFAVKLRAKGARLEKVWGGGVGIVERFYADDKRVPTTVGGQMVGGEGVCVDDVRVLHVGWEGLVWPDGAGVRVPRDSVAPSDNTAGALTLGGHREGGEPTGRRRVVLELDCQCVVEAVERFQTQSLLLDVRYVAQQCVQMPQVGIMVVMVGKIARRVRGFSRALRVPHTDFGSLQDALGQSLEALRERSPGDERDKLRN